jgi:hypothetical protein
MEAVQNFDGTQSMHTFIVVSPKPKLVTRILDNLLRHFLKTHSIFILNKIVDGCDGFTVIFCPGII